MAPAPCQANCWSLQAYGSPWDQISPYYDLWKQVCLTFSRLQRFPSAVRPHQLDVYTPSPLQTPRKLSVSSCPSQIRKSLLAFPTNINNKTCYRLNAHLLKLPWEQFCCLRLVSFQPTEQTCRDLLLHVLWHPVQKSGIKKNLLGPHSNFFSQWPQRHANNLQNQALLFKEIFRSLRLTHMLERIPYSGGSGAVVRSLQKRKNWKLNCFFYKVTIKNNTYNLNTELLILVFELDSKSLITLKKMLDKK